MLKNCSKDSLHKQNNSLSLLLIAAYQMVLAPFFGGNCRFHPSCSCYAQQAFQEYKWFYAFFLTLVRLFKCHPFGPSGYDPLPQQETLQGKTI